MKKIRLFLISLTLLFLMSVPVMAASAADDRSLINPLYEDENISVSVPIEEGQSEEECVGASSATPYYSSVKNAGVYLRTKMLNRTSGVNFRVYSTKTDWKEVLMDVINQACTANDETEPAAGDYLRWHFYSFTTRIDVSKIRTAVAKGGYYYNFNGIFIYMSTARQEQWVDNRVNALMSQLGIDQMTSEYDIIRAVYIYITQHVSYDYANLNNEEYLGKYSAYNALRYNSAICQGYANLLYRMLREAGLSVRFIGGYSQGEGHAWNIARIRGKYYNLDSTWDAGSDPENFKYFLKGGTWAQFNHDHIRDAEYRTDAFNEKYPMSSVPYVETTSAPVSYKITYNLNGGVNSDANPSSYFREEVILEDPMRAGYTFAGWYKESSFTNRITRISKTSARNYVLYAKWEKVVVSNSSVKYYKSDGVGLRVYFTEVENADGYRIAYSHSSSFAAGTVKYVYVDAGKDAKLIRENDCQRRYYVRIQAYRYDSADKKVFSKYSQAISGYVVKYQLDGGKNADTNPYYFYRRGTVLANPVKEGYKFAGWYADKKYTKKVTSISYTAGRGVVLYAKWK